MAVVVVIVAIAVGGIDAEDVVACVVDVIVVVDVEVAETPGGRENQEDVDAIDA